MKVKYFKDTDTAIIEFNNLKVLETIEINENIYIDTDKDNKLVSITIEHANANAKLPEFSYEEIEQQLIAS
jgi:uncharacterized protein YuzE